jgi:cytidine deaminase
MSRRALIARARGARRRAYAPYSGYAVGAALVCEDGTVFAGCNVENASYGLTVCAERNAILQAVAAGHRRFRALVVATSDGAPPCGACLQVAREFGADLAVTLVGPGAATRDTTLAALLPTPFTPRPHRRSPNRARRARARSSRSRPASGRGSS